jgi:hypothetical protein
MKLLNRYLNGNVTVTLFDNGTKIQEWDDNEQPNPEYPNSMDIKITDYCNAGCSWCHEKSTVDGKHADLEYLLDILQDLPRGTELAIGGGNPLDHPGLVPFLEACKSFGLIPNLTVNYKHISKSYKGIFKQKYVDLLNKLLDNNLIYGLGLSIPDYIENSVINQFNKKDNIVYHVIAGVNELSILDKIKKSPVQKCLILGYKDFGRGIKYRSEGVTNNLENWTNNLGQYIKKIHLSFDNLAIKQLEISKYLTQEEWDSFYCGDDGVFTMYMDAVKQEFAMSSTNDIRYPLIGDMKDIFNTIKKQKQLESLN